jgi:uncharacterized protein YcnI
MVIFMNNTLLSIAVTWCFLFAQHAWGHATLSPKQATQDSYQRLSFGISHGCEGSPTVDVVVELPESVMGAKPMPKPGWTVETEVRPLSTPYSLHGKEIKQDVRVIRWRGKLIDAHYDEFVVMSKLWNKTGPIFIPVTQLCEKGRMDWNQLPDGSGARLIYPAPVIEVMPGEHKH